MKKILIFSALITSTLLLFQCKKANPVVTFNPSQTNGGKIVFVNLDTLYSKYQLYVDSKKQLEDDYKKAETSIGGKFEAFQKKATDFQRKVMEIQQKAQDIAPIELKKLEEEFGAQQKRLADEEAALNKQREDALGGLDKKIQDLQLQLKNKIDLYLEKIASERAYDYV
ncbi:MAG: OmpH family outer membrane protein, partial [Saprospiraceae bacterium]